MTHTIPLSVVQDLCEFGPGFAERCVVRKIHRGTTPKQSSVRKGLVMPFASILRGSMSRDVGTPSPPVQLAPAPITAPTDAVLTRANAIGAGITRQASNTPKEPLRAERGNAVAYKDLQAAIDSALSARRDQEKREAFERGRSSFARLTPSKQSDAPRGGMGDAWSLRNASGKLVQAVLGVRKSESNTMPAGSMRPVTGATLSRG